MNLAADAVVFVRFGEHRRVAVVNVLQIEPLRAGRIGHRSAVHAAGLGRADRFRNESAWVLLDFQIRFPPGW